VSDSEQHLRERLVNIGKMMWDEGLTGKKSLYLAGGNISARIPGTNHVLIKPSGYSLGDLKPEQLIIVDTKGKVISGNCKPSIETPMHITIYRTRRDVGGIVHTHPLYCGILSLAGVELLPISYGGGMTAALMRGVKIVPWFNEGSQELADAVAAELKDRTAALLEFHGCITIGKTVEQAFHLASKLEESAEFQWRVMAIGKQPKLVPEAIRMTVIDNARQKGDLV
jgi:ribulose-5-phosphate 4-epimerase/fuculose-1-phosphate aldolase